MRRDGSEFPVELTITRIALPGPPYVHRLPARHHRARDRRPRTCGRRARGWLRWPTNERKRIQRNLHDGAQQRITSVLLCSRAACAHRPASASNCSTSPSTSSRPGLGRDPRARERPASGAAQRAGPGGRGRSAGAAGPMAIELEALPKERLAEPVEAAAYYVVAEALANVQKHAAARRVVVSVTADEHGLDVRVADEGSAEGPTRTARACAGWPTASRRSAAGSRWTARGAAGRCCGPRSRAARGDERPATRRAARASPPGPRSGPCGSARAG